MNSSLFREAYGGEGKNAKRISMEVKNIKDTLHDCQNYGQYEVTLKNGKDSVIQTDPSGANKENRKKHD